MSKPILQYSRDEYDRHIANVPNRMKEQDINLLIAHSY